MNTEAARWQGVPAVSVNAAPNGWYVALGPDEVQSVSLEQLQELLRRSIVNAQTWVWHPRAGRWQMLALIPEIGTLPTLRASPSELATPAPGSVAGLQHAPHGHSARADHHAHHGAAHSRAPAGLRPIDLPNPRMAAVSIPSWAGRSDGSGRWLLFLAVFAGVGLSFYRNGVLHECARALGREQLLIDLETQLGGPGFGTIRAVEREKARVAALMQITIVPTTASRAAALPPASNPAEAPRTTAETIAAHAAQSLAAAPVRNEPVTTASAPGRRSLAPTTTANAPVVAAATADGLATSPSTASARPAAPSRKTRRSQASETSTTEAPVRSSSALAATTATPAATPPPTNAGERDNGAVRSDPKPSAPARAPLPPKPAPIVEKPEAEMTAKERLDAAIRRTMNGGKAK